MAPMQANSSLAAVTFWTNSVRVYYQNNTGAIIEAATDDPSGPWSAGGPIGAQARLGSPLAAVAWGSGPEWSSSGGWVAGNLQQQAITVTSKSLAACMVTDAVIRLYYLPTDGASTTPIIEMAGDGTTWTKTTAVIQTKWRLRQGSPLSAIAWRDTTNHVRIYYAYEMANVLEMVFEEATGWTNGTNAISQSAAMRQTAAVTFGSGNTRQWHVFADQSLSGPNGRQDSLADSYWSNANTNAAWINDEPFSNMMTDAAAAAVAYVDGGKQMMMILVQGTKDAIGIWRKEPGTPYASYDGGLPIRT